MTVAQVAALFRRERSRFARSFPAVARAGLTIARRPERAPARRMAFAQVGGVESPIVGLYKQALKLPRANVVALIRHELGHVARPRGSEQEADNAAHAATGQMIRYDRRRIQTIGPGTYPRPLSIHR